MKKLFISLLLLSFMATAYAQPDSSKLVLLFFDSSPSCEVLEVAGKKVASADYLCDCVYPDIDDFTEYNSSEKISNRKLYYDGMLDFSPDDKILLLECGENKVVGKLPFEHRHLKIDAFLNDSTLSILFNGREITLAPEDIVQDTIIENEKHNGKLIRYTTPISIRNAGLILKENITTDFNAWISNENNVRGYYTIVETMPEFEGGSSNLSKYLAKNIGYPNGTSKVAVTSVYIRFMVDEEGNATQAKIQRSSGCALFDKRSIEVIENMPKWKPGLQGGKPVSVQYILPIHIDTQQ